MNDVTTGAVERERERERESYTLENKSGAFITVHNVFYQVFIITKQINKRKEARISA